MSGIKGCHSDGMEYFLEIFEVVTHKNKSKKHSSGSMVYGTLLGNVHAEKCMQTFYIEVIK